MGGGYAKIARPENAEDEEAEGMSGPSGNRNARQTSNSSGDTQTAAAAPQQSDAGGDSGGGNANNNNNNNDDDDDDDEAETPRTENKEIAEQVSRSNSLAAGSSAGGPPSNKPRSGNVKASKYAKLRIRWADQEEDGPPLAVPFYSDKLHYSVLFS